MKPLNNISNWIIRCKTATGSLFRNRVGGMALGMISTLAWVAPASAEIHKLSTDEMLVFKRISTNSEQQRETMKLDPILCLVARQRAADMVRRHYFGHTNPSGQGPNFLVRRAGYVLPVYYNQSLSGNNIESIGKGPGNPKKIITMWLKSSDHRPHILGELDFYRQQTSVGVGVVRSPEAPHDKYYVFLSAPPNAALSPRLVVLKDPKGATIATTRPLAEAFVRFTGMSVP